MNYYNENDPKAAAWLRELITWGQIPDGEVDDRSIVDVLPSDLTGFTQCHFFAGIGGWPLALRLAGWPTDRPVWTGSCPCQPFSQAGKNAGFADERHLWPSWHWLIKQCRPSRVVGEQVAKRAGLTWLDLVLTDLENDGYACRAAVMPAAGVGAPHQRDRLYWMADSSSTGLEVGGLEQARRQLSAVERSSTAGELGQPQSEQSHRGRDARRRRGEPADVGELGNPGGARGGRDTRSVPGPQSSAQGGLRSEPDLAINASGLGLTDSHGRSPGQLAAEAARHGRATVSASSWSTVEWVHCRDGKARPIEPGTFPLAHGVPGRVGLLRGYGNAIVPQLAAAFIEACA